MRAIEFRQFGDVSQLHLVDRPDPRATVSTAVVRIEAASVNPSDVKNVAGRMSQTTLPRIPGRDSSGVVVEGPAEWIGAWVWGTGGDVGFTRDGTHAEYIEVPRASLVRRPDHLSHEAAACLGVIFLTAWCGVVDYARLSKGETLAVIGAGGGVGGAAIQLAKYLGARVVAISRGPLPEESPAAKLADVRIATASQGLDGIRADVVLDTVGGAMFETAVKLLAHRGRLVEISGGSERRVGFDLIDFYRNESQLFGVDSLKRGLTAAAEILRLLTPGFEAGAYVAPPISKVLPLEQAREAYQLVADGQPGRVVLRP
jgi:NADPH:quinone reductase-like Zn-dependent oxidoreductase